MKREEKIRTSLKGHIRIHYITVFIPEFYHLLSFQVAYISLANIDVLLCLDEPASSVSVVSDYGLHYLAIEVRSPAEAKDFSSGLCLQTISGAYPAFCPMGTGGPFPVNKARPGRDADHSPSSSIEVKKEQELDLLSPQAPPWRVVGLLYLFLPYPQLL
jgi:hypothetical protein